MKTITTIMTAALLTAASVQLASAAQRDHRNAHRAHAVQTQRAFDANAFYAPNDGYYSNRLQGLYEGGAISAPAGR